MSTFHLKITTPDGLQFDGDVARLRVRMVDGDVSMLPRHSDYVSAVGAGEAALLLEDGTMKRAACIGGMLTMIKNECSLIATTFEWADEIDKDRAERAKAAAEQRIAAAQDKKELMLAQAKLQRSLVRLKVKN